MLSFCTKYCHCYHLLQTSMRSSILQAKVQYRSRTPQRHSLFISVISACRLPLLPFGSGTSFCQLLGPRSSWPSNHKEPLAGTQHGAVFSGCWSCYSCAKRKARPWRSSTKSSLSPLVRTLRTACGRYRTVSRNSCCSKTLSLNRFMNLRVRARCRTPEARKRGGR